MKQCCANCKWLGKPDSWGDSFCTFYDVPMFKAVWWRKRKDAPIYIIATPTRSGKTCKCWQEKR